MFPQLQLDNVKTNSIANRKSKVKTDDFAKVFSPDEQSFSDFIDSFPNILCARDLKLIAASIVKTRRENFPCILMMGAHVIKVGLAPIIIDLMERGIITAIAMNSAAAIHDVETTLFGVTSEDVAANLLDGSFGMSKETGEFINTTLSDAHEHDQCGYAEAIGKKLIDVNAMNQSLSILASSVRLNIPASVHVAIGTDIVHQQPTMNGAATGELSFRDFKVLCASVKDLQNGGVVLNVGSAVILPEVFLKVLTVVRNLGYPANGFMTANFDMIQHYRPRVNVVERPTQNGGEGFTITGHHEIMIPLLAAMVKSYSSKEQMGIAHE